MFPTATNKKFFGNFFLYNSATYWNSNISKLPRMDVEHALEDSNEDMREKNDKIFFVRSSTTFVEICGRYNLVFH